MPPAQLSTSFGNDVVLGSTQPRLWTRPLRPLEPDTSYGFEVCEFARDVLGHPLDEWQEWVVIHAGELLPDGRPRFRKVLLLVSRQAGKTELGVVLTLYWLYVQQVALILGTSTKLTYAQESWEKAVKLAQSIPELAAEIPAKGGIRRASGEIALKTSSGSRYMIAASNEEGGRSLTLDRVWIDELRQHYDYSAWDAAVPATDAVRDAQIWCASNAGSDRSVVLNDLREAAISYIETGTGDQRLGLFEYSAPEGASPLDMHALAQANPNLGRRNDPDALIGDATRAVAKGGAVLAGFRTERMCQRVTMMDPAIDPDSWRACLDVGTLDAVRGRVALCLDVSIDQQHATLVAAAKLDDDRVRVEVVQSWEGSTALQQMRGELPGLVAQVKPLVLAWLPSGPAAAVAADLAGLQGRQSLPGVKLTEIKGEVTAVCMGLAEQVTALKIAHSADPLLDAHVSGAEKVFTGDAWKFTRKGGGHVDAAYAAAGAVHAARTLPPASLGVIVLLPGDL